MTPLIHEWLPEQAFTAARVGRALTACLDEWSQAWGGDALDVGRITLSDSRHASNRDGKLSASVKSCGASSEGRAKRALLETVLGTSLQGRVLNERDHQLLDALALGALEDLAMRCDGALSSFAAPTSTVDRAIITIRSANAEVAEVDVPHSGLAALVKAQLIHNPNTQIVSCSRNAALQAAPIELEAVLGVNMVRFADVAGLAVGDILLLDRAIDEPAELRVAGGDAVLGTGMLGRQGDRIALTLN